VVLLGSLDEKALAGVIAQEGVTDLTGKLGLPELAAAIKRLKLLICNDGGPMHMAVALGVSTVSVFGPVDEKEYGPYPPDKRHIVVGKDLSCRPCYKNFRFPGCSNERRCLEDITVDEVYRKVKELL
jgi:ADP-heptose:LPS heptosyltransferase